MGTVRVLLRGARPTLKLQCGLVNAKHRAWMDPLPVAGKVQCEGAVTATRGLRRHTGVKGPREAVGARGPFALVRLREEPADAAQHELDARRQR